MIIIGVDTGGTFTDFIYKRDGEWGVYKLLSTPHNPSEAVIEGLKHIVDKESMQVVHGSTVATNAILERKGVKTAIVTNKGFEDLIQIGRQNRTRLYDLYYRKESVIVPQDLRFGVQGRFSSQGEEIEPLNEKEAADIFRAIERSGAESVAVCLLFSYLNPDHERRLGQYLDKLGVHMSLSHEILAEFREFERLSTTVVNAYVSPKMSRYLQNLKAFMGENPLRVMQSNGGSISVETAMEESVRTILSGPAGGVVGAMEMGHNAGFDKIISFDMGGTSTDVCLIDGNLPLSLESKISGYPLKVPMIDIHTVGAGGGSIARLDQGGSLKVGPESAGADPGPICYGKGTEITVTDANLFLGRLIADRFLGGNMRLHRDRMNDAFSTMAGRIGLKASQLAEGIVDVANTNMERAIRVISVERGFDPREFTLFSFGGAGGMHCAYLAKLLSIPHVLVPNNPGILSAVGMVMADVIKDYSQTVMLPGSEAATAKLSELFSPLEKQGRSEMFREGFDEGTVYLERYLDMRYQGQSFEIIVPFEEDYIEGFARLHELKYGYRNPDKPVEIVNVRLRARGTPQKPKFKPAENLTESVPQEAIVGREEVIFDGNAYQTSIMDRERLLPGNKFDGPAVIVEYTSTIVVPPFAGGEMDGYGNILMSISS